MLLLLQLATVTSVASYAGVVMVLAISFQFPPDRVNERQRHATRTNGKDPINTNPPDANTPVRRFDVALTFPGEHRTFVKAIAHALATSLSREKIFYDEFYEAELARPNLDIYLQKIYHDDSRLIVVFLCRDYDNKEWCHLEARAVRDLIKQRRDEEVMFVRVGDGEVKGVFSVDGYVDARGRSADGIASLIIEQLRKQQPALSPPFPKPDLRNDLKVATSTGGLLVNFPIAHHLMDACRDVRFLSPGDNYEFNRIGTTVMEAQRFYDEEQSEFRTFNIHVGFRLRAEATSMMCAILGQQMQPGDALEQLLVNFIAESLPRSVTQLLPGEPDIRRIYDIAVGDIDDPKPIDAITQILVSRYEPESG